MKLVLYILCLIYPFRGEHGAAQVSQPSLYTCCSQIQPAKKLQPVPGVTDAGSHYEGGFVIDAVAEEEEGNNNDFFKKIKLIARVQPVVLSATQVYFTNNNSSRAPGSLHVQSSCKYILQRTLRV